MGHEPDRPIGNRYLSYRNGCPSHKNTYETKRAAKRAIRRMEARQHKLMAYRCRQCNEFHLTSMPYAKQVQLGLIDPRRAQE